MLLRITKLLAVVIGGVLAVAVLTLVWIARIAGMFQSMGAGHRATDIALLMHSPVYWVLIIAVFAIAVVACCRWVFA
jgi:hypothetical protein